MICPHCGYRDGWDPDCAVSVSGELGEFYCVSNNIVMYNMEEQKRYLKGCPSCNKIFMSN